LSHAAAFAAAQQALDPYYCFSYAFVLQESDEAALQGGDAAASLLLQHRHHQSSLHTSLLLSPMAYSEYVCTGISATEPINFRTTAQQVRTGVSKHTASLFTACSINFNVSDTQNKSKQQAH
jgi:hypothetical protein